MYFFFFRCLLSKKVPSLRRESSAAQNQVTVVVVIPLVQYLPVCLVSIRPPSVWNGSASALVTIFPVLTSHNMEIYSSESSPLATQSPACTE